MRFTFGSKMVGRALRATGRDPEELAYKVLPSFLLGVIQKYLRVRSVGSSHLPKKGPAIIISNHSGFMGFDALMLAYEIYQKKKRVARIIAHKLWFFRPEISVHAKKLGLVPATFENGLRIIKKNEMLILFPEGEEGNFKPSRQMYHLKRFRRGFIRLALHTGAPIIPSMVIGAEETHITLSQIRWAKEVLGIIIPIPLNVIPIPVKWRIKFLKPIYIEKNPEKAEDMAYVTRLTREVRKQLQQAIHAELKHRKTLFT